MITMVFNCVCGLFSIFQQHDHLSSGETYLYFLPNINSTPPSCHRSTLLERTKRLDIAMLHCFANIGRVYDTFCCANRRKLRISVTVLWGIICQAPSVERSVRVQRGSISRAICSCAESLIFVRLHQSSDLFVCREFNICFHAM
jgi:hypothetical protein